MAADLARFLARLAATGPAAEQLARDPQLSARLTERWHQAQAAWPGVVVGLDRFLDHLAERVPADAPETWTELFTDDLYLAAGCADGDNTAIAACERACRRDLERALASVNAPTSVHDDVISALRARVFVGTTEQPPAIVAFSGRGTLRKWIRVAATRLALNTMRSQRRETTLPDAVDLPDTADDLALGHLKRTYQDAFRAAFAEAIAELTAEQRTLLRMHLIDKLTIDDLARLHQVHRTSTARWLREARAALADGTRRRLHGALGVGDTELDSIMVLVRSRLDLSLTRLLAEARAKPDDD